MDKEQHIRVAVDAVVFGYNQEEGLSVLLIKRKYEPWKDMWALPGGFVMPEESLEAAVSRELEEETGIENTYLEQLYTFGNPDRDPRQRVISIAYFALVRPEHFQLQARTDAADVRWFDFKKLPELCFDHKHILEVAIDRIRSKITYEPIVFHLLDETFTFPELLTLYETLLGENPTFSLERRNFKKKLKTLGFLEEVNERRKQPGSGRPAQLYRFNRNRYILNKEKGVFEVLFPQSSSRK